jgi:hypothetical protein
MTKDDEALRRDVLIASLTARLRPLCSEWPDAVFTEMVQHLADITIKYDTVAPIGTPYDRRTTDRLVADLHEMLEKSEANRRGAKWPRDDIPKD